MHEYHDDSNGILEYINTLEAAQKKLKRVTGKNTISYASLLLISTNAMLNTYAYPHTTDRWEDLDKTVQTWDARKTA